MSKQLSENKWQLVTTLPASTTSLLLPMAAITDRFRVEIQFASINANIFKTDTGPFSRSLSNMSEASLVSISNDEQQNGIVYPNPTSDVFSVAVEDAIAVTVSNLDGQVLIAEKVANKQSVSIANLAKGTYIISIESKQGTVKQTIIKN